MSADINPTPDHDDSNTRPQWDRYYPNFADERFGVFNRRAVTRTSSGATAGGA